MEPHEPLRLKMSGIKKRFGKVQALNAVDLDVRPGEVHGLLGGNGAGKTTLMNVLYGLYGADGGTIEIDGSAVSIKSPRDALEAGVGMVHQTFLQVDNYSVLENVVLGGDVGGNALTLNLEPARERITELSQRFGLSVDLDAIVEELPVGVRQRVEILKALYRGSTILVLDEPTTNLTPQEVDDLFGSITAMVNEGMSVILITHKIQETMSICDRMTIMRLGERIETVNKVDTGPEELAAIMVGDSAEESAKAIALGVEIARSNATSEVAVTAASLVIKNDHRVDLFQGFDLQVHAGEVLGVAGVAGNGQVELAEAMAGVRPVESGHITLQGRSMTGLSRDEWLAGGVAYVPEDRYRDAILPTGSITENLLLGSQRESGVKKHKLIDWRAAHRRAVEAIDRFSIRASDAGALVGSLSGGNIQRVILARAFAHRPRLLILHNPTRGLDIRSTQFVYEQVDEATRAGCAVLLISEDLDEVIAQSDRVLALYSGRLTGQWLREEAEPYEIGRSMTGLVKQA
ncbi:ABC transporter ATP-binding protein [Aeromicrobium sp.]|uniref:ABC transporter ATP-binding protein n=1 Tax=Aeromicrobium sp. TaxID=1871063 RepID=UPI0028A9AEE0|nr:ABC transporter ATP-binding protein [Aeromicrobium sp.]